jgi:RimJ/RimL family protein N-acetyltransferase
LLIRCWDPRDAPLLKEAVDSSLDHLRPWAHWAHDEPSSLEEKVQLIRGFRGRFDLGQDFAYAIFASNDSEVLGGTGLHTRVGDGALEIGYCFRRPRATLSATRSSSHCSPKSSPRPRWWTSRSRPTTA